MKFLAILVIMTAVGLFGSAFLGIYTAPGLEEFPTAKSLGLLDGKEKEKKKPSEADEKKKKSSGIFPVNTDGKISERNNYLNQNKGKVAPGS